jgi:sortase (surface protein transpeptidase)
MAILEWVESLSTGGVATTAETAKQEAKTTETKADEVSAAPSTEQKADATKAQDKSEQKQDASAEYKK